ncbi:hypothetical protein KIW84_056765 [Lathyrus oleraceus]|uniref:Uncharacterized protein n=1 Tax=Pisum sativum TaxID=3888 RepID=A0A9D4X1G7_PEA|nr:hypothetical protein KIW84_056761 [Pisum sativum]KAI5411812.1 hypothetical protein KIW84_056763 [Pisum sativum]KAI5411814.1 hypothetical protein KIW84_056765 [Pisum sativum]
MTSIGTCCISAIKTSQNMTINDHEGGSLELQKFNACDGDSSHIIVHSLPVNSNQVDKLSTRFQPKKTGTDVLAGAADKVEELGDFVVCHATNADSEIQVHRENKTDVVEQDWNDQFKHIEEPSLGVFSVPSFDLCGETQNEKPNLVNNFSASELSDIDRRNIVNSSLKRLLELNMAKLFHILEIG